MFRAKDHSRNPPGFALLVVLSTLAILTLLFAISTRLSLAHIRAQSTEVSIARHSFQRTELLRLASDVIAAEEDNASGRHTLTLGGTPFEIEIIDVGGLIDLNTASPPLLSAYFEFLGLTQPDFEEFRRWRQTNGRLLRVDDLGRIIGGSEINRTLLKQTATVHSGRTGLASDHSQFVLTDSLSRTIDMTVYDTPPSNANLALFAFEIPQRRIGVVHRGPQTKIARIN